MKSTLVEKDIQFIVGLRGLAILLVLLFHFDSIFLANGFIGVDIFFWISGYLLFRNFLNEFDAHRGNSKSRLGWIDVKFYYLKRAKRILPLVFVVLILYLVSKFFTEQTTDLSQLQKQISGILTFSYNTQLSSSNENYFQLLQTDSGLLHFWTLAVEEQVYLALPIIFVIAASFRGIILFGKHINWVTRQAIFISLLTTGSIALIMASDSFGMTSSYVFYSSLTRFWEFGLGCLVAILEFKGAEKIFRSFISTLYREIAAIAFFIGIFLIPLKSIQILPIIPILAISIFYLLSLGEFDDSFLGKSMLLVPIRFLGRISFPLYLVHWPIASFFSDEDKLSIPVFQIVGIVTSIILAYLLHRFVEAPIARLDISRFRTKKPRYLFSSTSRPLIPKSGSIAIFLIYILFLSYISDPQLAKNNFVKIGNFLTTPREASESVILETATDSVMVPSPLAPSSKADSLPKESNSQVKKELENGKFQINKLDLQWKEILNTASQAKTLPANYSFKQADLERIQNDEWNACLNSSPTRDPCTFGTGNRTAMVIGDSYAFALVPAIRSALQDNWKIVVLTRGLCLPWQGNEDLLNGMEDTKCVEHNLWVKSVVEKSNPEIVVFSAADKVVSGKSFTSWQKSFELTIQMYEKLSGKVFIIPSVPGAGNLKNCLKSMNNIEGCYGKIGTGQKFLNFQLSLERSRAFRVLNLTPYLCKDEWCPPIIDSLPVYSDGNHLSSIFSERLGPVLFSNGLK